jgi:hypothetical protein
VAGAIWNWKSAVLSVALRTPVFFAATLSAGMSAAVSAAGTDIAFRVVVAGFCGALVQRASRAGRHPLAAFGALVLVPGLSHVVEALVHARARTPHLGRAVLGSVVVTVFSTCFDLFAMRRGAFVVGAGAGGLTDDLVRLPRLLGQFLQSALRAPLRLVRCTTAGGPAGGRQS